MLQPEVSVSPVTITQGDEEGSSKRMEEEPFSFSSPSCHAEFYVLSTSMSAFFSQDHLNAVDVAAQPSPQKAHTGIWTARVLVEIWYCQDKLTDRPVILAGYDTLDVLQMVVACLGLDNATLQPAQSNVLF